MSRDLGMFVAGGKTGLLLIHDFAGSPRDLDDLASALVRQGMSVACPHNAGAVGGEAGADSGWLPALDAALLRLQAMCDEIFVCGHGAGAVLALQMAGRHPEALRGLILYSPTLRPAPLSGVLPEQVLSLGRELSGWITEVFRATGLGTGTAAAMSTKTPSGADDGSPSRALAAAAIRADQHRLSDAVAPTLPGMTKPVLLLHQRGGDRATTGGVMLLQKRLGGRVESMMLDLEGADDADGARTNVADRIRSFIAAVLSETATAEANSRRRKRMAGGGSGALG